ncbi:MAG: sigma-70 family RNA polymerase sigma factor [Acidobacteriia bacterium]|nr:sigma-70 family RNA polymerase sigma factor [Terriglobia bacterium]
MYGGAVTFSPVGRMHFNEISENQIAMSEEHDDRLQVEAAQRDPSRFADLYEQNFYRVYAYVVRRVADRHQAKDLTADVFREALAGIQKFEWRGVPFAAWLLGIASRLVAGYWKSSGREAGNPTLAPDAAVPSDIERSAMLFQLVERLPAAQQRVIEARFVERKSIREIAVELDRSEGAVKQLQLRAIDNLRVAMEADG